jgi:ABC-type multidrug transport system permease subunit
MLVALKVRVGLSLALFFLLMIAWYFGLIAPHGLQPR